MYCKLGFFFIYVKGHTKHVGNSLNAEVISKSLFINVEAVYYKCFHPTVKVTLIAKKALSDGSGLVLCR